MALGTFPGKTGLRVVGIGRIVVDLKMTSSTRRGSPRKLACGMASRAIQAGMGANQGKSCRGCMIKSAQPTVGAVAGLAFCRKAGRRVIDSFCRLEILDMAGNAVGAEPLEFAYSRILVTV